ncbi:hypothetical protein BDY19DRAFT_921503 [Irpex rosettiformis]|uniref:Uncharacterized protein n=1 Tax=Irpex rosettiformis TaxID=378272 RepID=A0ACB8UFA3_9APHY|nr:hypothetical protein BDY19DRAFT_921503 [Irpex rosettiformis]
MQVTLQASSFHSSGGHMVLIIGRRRRHLSHGLRIKSYLQLRLPLQLLFYIRTWANFGGSKGSSSRKSLLEDIIKFAATNPDLRTPTSRFYNHQTEKIVEDNPTKAEADKKHIYNGPWDRDHFFELQFLAALFVELDVDFTHQVLNIMDLLGFLTHVCNGAHNLCDIAHPLHEAKNSVFTNKGSMTKELLAYLKVCYADFHKFVDSELHGEGEAGQKDHPTRAYYTLLKALKTTPFYTNQWPNVGQSWWVA